MTATDEHTWSPPISDAPAHDSEMIRSAPSPICCLCGGRGEVIHSALPDRLFDAPGVWNLKQCSNSSCRLIWLDPMPLTQDLGKAYTSYYTHATDSENAPAGLLKRTYRMMKR